MCFKILVLKEEASNSAYFSIYVIVTLPDDDRHKRLKVLCSEKKQMWINKHKKIIIQ